ncbi:Fe(3+) ABC transporter substrate-binding protein [Aliiglaciecola litoralis]|uniref:Fe(3+) ABC transporter substrate-binding protein n=2 Tax=Aliiglaciecola litoralis TaxID=582857 RepID=A0ABN1LDD6_9ALTE
MVNAAEVNVYSARKEALIKPALDDFAKQTGIQVNLITGNADALISRIKSEGKFSPADILLTTDAGRLVRAKQLGLTQGYTSDTVKNVVPSALRDTQGHWFALTMRARPIMVIKGSQQATQQIDYETLAKPDLNGKVCVRSSSNIYNQSMLSARIHQLGAESTEQFVKGLVRNFARPPKGGDRDQIKAMVAGQCQYAIANTYYLAGMLESNDPAEVKVAEQVKVLWPNQDNRGTHVNISGAALMQYAPNTEAAKQLLDFLLSEKSQSWYAEVNHEYPVRDGVAWSQVLTDMGQFKSEVVPLEKVGELNADAVKLMDRAGWK